MIKVGNVIRTLVDIKNHDGSIYIKKDKILVVNFILPFKFSDGIHAIDYEEDGDPIYRFDIEDIDKTIKIISANIYEWMDSIELMIKQHERDQKLNNIL